MNFYINTINSVSYTHLDVYKRQVMFGVVTAVHRKLYMTHYDMLLSVINLYFMRDGTTIAPSHFDPHASITIDMTLLKSIPIRDVKIVVFVTAVDTVKMFREEETKTVA